MDNYYIEVQKSRRIIIETRIKDEYIRNLKSTNTNELDVIYDLIQTGLVEKVEEKDERN